MLHTTVLRESESSIVCRLVPEIEMSISTIRVFVQERVQKWISSMYNKLWT